MTNTIANVPRELLENLIEQHITAHGFTNETARKSQLLLSDPSPAGVDGLEVVAYRTEWTARDGGSRRVSFGSSVPCQELVRQDYPEAVLGEAEQLCRLSDAQAIIDGLRGEVESRVEAALAAERDVRHQQAQRIGELEAALEFACKSLAQVTSSDGSGHADIAVSVLRMAGRKEADASQIVEACKAGAKWRIGAALSAGKEWE